MGAAPGGEYWGLAHAARVKNQFLAVISAQPEALALPAPGL